jgi:hypothetical protein
MGIMDIIRIVRKSRHLNKVERYHIYKVYKNNLHMNDVHIEAHNQMFQIVYELCDR